MNYSVCFRYYTQLEGGRIPVYAVVFQEPENDPRNCCYLWAVQSTQDRLVCLWFLKIHVMKAEGIAGEESNWSSSFVAFEYITTARCDGTTLCALCTLYLIHLVSCFMFLLYSLVWSLIFIVKSVEEKEHISEGMLSVVAMGWFCSYS